LRSWLCFPVIFEFIKPNALEIALFYAFMYFLIEALTTDRPKDLQDVPARRRCGSNRPLVCAALILADAAFLVLKDQFSSHLKITAIDVGQGSSALVRCPGRNMLIDGGGFHDSSFDVGRAVIAPFFTPKEYERSISPCMTHPHPDHLQGLIHIVMPLTSGSMVRRSHSGQ
jgi:competence protein ComEC